MELSNLPFRKLLIYLGVLTRFQRDDFYKKLEIYLPSIHFIHTDILDEIFEFIGSQALPKTIVSGKYTNYEFTLFLKKFKLVELNTFFENEDFLDFVYDIDRRRTLDGMSLSNAFRPHDILKEFSDVNSIVLSVYLDCFANFALVKDKDIYVRRYIKDKEENSLFVSVINNTSKNYLRIALGLKALNLSPKEMMQDALLMVAFKAKSAFLSEDDDRLEKFVKLQVGVAEKLLRIDAGLKSDFDDLIRELKATPTYEDPKVYTPEELEELSRSHMSDPLEQE